MPRVDRMLAWVEGLSSAFGALASWLTTLLVLVVGFDVATRYLFDFSWVAVQEAQWHLFAAIFLLGAAYTLQRDRHVRVDVLYSTFEPRTRAAIDLIGLVLFLVPFCLLGAKLGWEYATASFSIGEGSPQPGGLPARWALKAVVPLAFTLLLLEGIVKAAASWRTLRRPR